jgi:hypothetical protein
VEILKAKTEGKYSNRQALKRWTYILTYESESKYILSNEMLDIEFRN